MSNLQEISNAAIVHKVIVNLQGIYKYIDLIELE